MKPEVRPVRVEALGDDFALVEGQWLRGTRIAQHLANADAVWAFYVDDVEAVAALIDNLAAREGKRVIGLAPGRNPEWAAGQGECIRAMFTPPPPQSACVGLLMALPSPVCACPHRQGDCPGKCGGCGGTNPCPRALDNCKNESPDGESTYTHHEKERNTPAC